MYWLISCFVFQTQLLVSLFTLDSYFSSFFPPCDLHSPASLGHSSHVSSPRLQSSWTLIIEDSRKKRFCLYICSLDAHVFACRDPAVQNKTHQTSDVSASGLVGTFWCGRGSTACSDGAGRGFGPCHSRSQWGPWSMDFQDVRCLRFSVTPERLRANRSMLAARSLPLLAAAHSPAVERDRKLQS